MDLIVRSKVEAIYDARNRKSGIIALEVSDWIKENRFNRYKAVVRDFVVSDVENPLPGKPLKTYKQIANNDGAQGNPKEKRVLRTYEEVKGLFTFFNKTIQPTDNYNEEMDWLIVKGLLLDTQQNPIYGLGPDDWGIIDRSLEIAPVEEPPTI